MKITVTVRTLNESGNIARFCECYSWADEIIIADAMSEDNTLDIARKFKNTHIYQFTERVFPSKVYTSPRGKHINFLFDRAREHGADWIIFDDCDCVPTKDLQERARILMGFESDKKVIPLEYDQIHAYRMFVYGKDSYAPDLNKPGQSLWAWKSDVTVKAKEDDPLVFEMVIPKGNILYLENPFALLHYCWPSEEEISRKNEFYKLTGEMQNPADPLRQYRFEKLPEWARWK